MAARPYRSQENSHSIPVAKCGIQEEQARKTGERQDKGDAGWTFQILLNALADGDEQRLFECISHLECRIREFEKKFGFFLQKRTQVLAGLQDYAAAHGQHLTDVQIRKYRKNKEGRQASMIYHGGKQAS